MRTTLAERDLGASLSRPSTGASAQASEHYTLAGRKLMVFDGLLSPAEIAAVQAMFVQVPYARRTSFDGELNYGMTPEEFAQFPRLPAVVDTLFTQLRERFDIEDPGVRFGHAYAAVFHPTDTPVKHTDGPTTQAMSFVYYANPQWSDDWGGETLFFDAAGELAVKVHPRPGRIAVFHANILHSAGTPAPHAPLLRHAISAFYYHPQGAS